MSFRDEPRSARIYVFLVILAGLSFLLLNRPNIPKNYLLIFFFFVGLHVILEQLDVPLPRGNGTVSVSFAIILAVMLIFGPAAAAWANFASLIHIRTLKSFYKMLFNACQFVLSAGIAGHAYIYFGGTYLYRGGTQITTSVPNSLFAVLLAVVVYFFINTFLIMGVISLSQKVSFIGIWLTNFKWSVPNYFATAPLGILIVTVYININWGGVLLLIIPLMVARHTFIMYMDMRNQYLSTIRALTKAIDAKDHYTHGHSERVAQYSVWIGEELRLAEDFLEKLEYLALMHDIGKIGIPEHILNKPSRLSDEEFALVRAHSAIGADIISNIKYIGEHADIVRHHHERMDGQGYPDGLKGDQISLGARIVGVADSFDAMTSERVYTQIRTKQEAVTELRRCCNAQYSQDVVDAFVKVLQRKGELT
jgi:hypothetical protein